MEEWFCCPISWKWSTMYPLICSSLKSLLFAVQHGFSEIPRYFRTAWRRDISEPVSAMWTKMSHSVQNTISHLYTKFQGPGHLLSAGGGMYRISKWCCTAGGGWIDTVFSQLCQFTWNLHMYHTISWSMRNWAHGRPVPHSCTAYLNSL